jgi:hypothetical protein
MSARYPHPRFLAFLAVTLVSGKLAHICQAELLRVLLDFQKIPVSPFQNPRRLTARITNDLIGHLIFAPNAVNS